MYPVLDEQKRAKPCRKPSTTSREVEDGGMLDLCDEHAATFDAKAKANAPPVVDFTDRDAARAWLAAISVSIEDATSVTADMLAPLRDRRLGPVEARRLHREAVATLRDLLGAAERGLTAGSRSKGRAP